MLIRFFTRRATDPQPNLVMNFWVLLQICTKNAGLLKGAAS
jgi:hypothetical protein